MIDALGHYRCQAYFCPHSGERLTDHFLVANEKTFLRLLSSLWFIASYNATTNPAMESHVNERLTEIMTAYRENSIAIDAASDNGRDDRFNHSVVSLNRCPEHVNHLAVGNGLQSAPISDAAIGHFRDPVRTCDSPKLIEAL